MYRRTALLGSAMLPRGLLDTLNNASSMTMSSKGKKSPHAHRAKMPWTNSKEYIPTRILKYKDKTLLEGAPSLDYGLERSAQLDPLEVLKGSVALRKFHVSTGYSVFQLAPHLPFHGRGQRFYRKEWREGTYDKFFTLASIDFDRDQPQGEVWGFMTFHGETSLDPVRIEYADVPGWFCDVDVSRAVPFNRVVPAPPSEGTEVPVDPKRFRLKAYPYYDPPNPVEFVERLLRERGVLPDMAPAGEESELTSADRKADDGSVDLDSSR